MKSGISNQCFKKYIKLLNSNTKNEIEYKNIIMNVLSLLLSLICLKVYSEVFIFTGKSNSGIGLFQLRKLPKNGFCFCTSLRLERRDQSREKAKGDMVIFKLSSCKVMELELFIRDGYIHYKVCLINGESNTINNVIKFQSRRLEEDKWYFIEFYHINKSLQNNLILYINSNLVEAHEGPNYNADIKFDENTIGCHIESDNINEQREERLCNNFHGEMTTIIFISSSKANIENIHLTLKKINSYYKLENIIEVITNNSSGNTKDFINLNFVKKIFILIDPKYTSKTIKDKRIISMISINSKTLYLYNNAEQVYEDTIIEHNINFQNNLKNIGGIISIIPLLYNIVEHNPSSEFMYLLK